MEKTMSINGHNPEVLTETLVEEANSPLTNAPIRLNKAAGLLTSKSGTVTEIAYRVGFNSLSWFTKCFKEQYGLSPSEFAQN